MKRHEILQRITEKIQIPSKSLRKNVSVSLKTITYMYTNTKFTIIGIILNLKQCTKLIFLKLDFIATQFVGIYPEIDVNQKQILLDLK